MSQPVRDRRPPADCPVCRARLLLTRLACDDCGTELSGVFTRCEFCSLDDADRAALRVFLTSRGNLRELARHLDVSYPTARARFDALLERMGLAPAAPDPTAETLEALARGELTVDEAEARLRAT